MKTVSIVLLMLCCSGLIIAQVPLVSAPVSLDLGFGGGLSIPSGTLADANKSGYHLGAKLRLKSVLPVTLVASANYNRLPEKATDKTDAAWMVGGGLEYSLPGVIVSPYLGVDAMLNISDNGGSGASSTNRGGLGFGGGVLFALPGFGSFDASVKYQMLNVMGKVDNEQSVSQIAANVSIMVTVL